MGSFYQEEVSSSLVGSFYQEEVSRINVAVFVGSGPRPDQNFILFDSGQSPAFIRHVCVSSHFRIICSLNMYPYPDFIM